MNKRKDVQGFKYFSRLPVLHYLQVVLFFINFHEYLIQHSLKSGGTKDNFRQVKVPDTAPYWEAWHISHKTDIWAKGKIVIIPQLKVGTKYNVHFYPLGIVVYQYLFYMIQFHFKTKKMTYICFLSIFLLGLFNSFHDACSVITMVKIILVFELILCQISTKIYIFCQSYKSVYKQQGFYFHFRSNIFLIISISTPSMWNSLNLSIKDIKCSIFIPLGTAAIILKSTMVK